MGFEEHPEASSLDVSQSLVSTNTTWGLMTTSVCFQINNKPFQHFPVITDIRQSKTNENKHNLFLKDVKLHPVFGKRNKQMRKTKK